MFVEEIMFMFLFHYIPFPFIMQYITFVTSLENLRKWVANLNDIMPPEIISLGSPM